MTYALDTFIVLARNTLVLNNPDTYDSAYALLKRASTLVLPGDGDVTADAATFANYMRCVSSAFHNLAWTLYQGQRYSYAVRFLNDSCALGSRGLSMHGQSGRRVSDEKEDTREAWRQFEQHLYRRWEILGVCQLKTGDHKVCRQIGLSMYAIRIGAGKLTAGLHRWPMKRSWRV